MADACQLGLYDNPPQVEQDVCLRKARGHKNSIKAHEHVVSRKAADWDSIRMQVAAVGFHGLTIKEIKLWNEREQRFKYPNEYSGRLAEMKRDGKIFDSHREREGCTVYVSRLEWVTPE